MDRTHLTKGARASLDLIRDQLKAIRLYAAEARAEAKRNPVLAQTACADIIDCVLDVDRILKDQLEPLLERRSGPKELSVQGRLDALEQEVALLRQALTTPDESSVAQQIRRVK